MIVIALLLAQSVPVPAAPCTTDAVLPPALAFWNQPTTGNALALFRPSILATTKAPNPTPARPGKIASARFTITETGAYTIALGAAGWIDVVASGGQPLASIAHAHGPSCTTIRKLVAFKLATGSYTLKLSGLAAAAIKVALVPGSPPSEAGK